MNQNDIEKLAALLDVPETTVELWADALEGMAADCLELLNQGKRDKALFWGTAFFIDTARGQVASESLGDASMSFTITSNQMRANPYGRAALGYAPCLIGLSGDKQYGGVRLIR